MELTYDLYSLPTAQHRAGLAGLLVLLGSMRRRGIEDLPRSSVAGPGLVRVKLTEGALTTMFNDLYDASVEEVAQQTMRKDRGGNPIPPLRTEQQVRRNARSGKETTRTVHIYPMVVPKAGFLMALQTPGAWAKLWRDAVWNTLRGIPKTRIPYEERARGGVVSETAQIWADLQKWQKARSRGTQYTVEIASSIYLGAQARNAEGVPFRGSPDENLLLHCWPVVMGVGEARRLKLDEGKTVEETTGYVLSIPDVTDIEAFSEEFPDVAAQLGEEMHGFRPRNAVLALPQEGALEYLHHLLTLARARAQRGNLRFSVSGVEVYHLAKEGNNVRTYSVARVDADQDTLQRYEALRSQARHPLLRGQLILNLLRSDPWYHGFDRLFAREEHRLFVGESGASFAWDARRTLQTELAV